MACSLFALPTIVKQSPQTAGVVLGSLHPDYGHNQPGKCNGDEAKENSNAV